MPVLTDVAIRERLSDDLVVEPMEDPDLQVQPSSIDLRLGRDAKKYDPETTYITPDTELEGQMVEKTLESGEKLPVHPDDFVLVPTQEWVEIPRDLQGQVTGRSSVGRLGIEVHSTAGLIDPGYEGQIVLEVSNNAPVTVELEPGMRVAQLVLHDTIEDPHAAYGERGDSKYMHQTGAQESLVNRDTDR
jgi:dCTP deaminase